MWDKLTDALKSAAKKCKTFGRALVRNTSFTLSEMKPTKGQLLIAILLILFLGAGICVNPILSLLSQKQVNLSVGSSKATLSTRSETVAELLMEYDIVIGEGDVIYPELSSVLYRGEDVMVRRAITVSITVDGETTSVSLLNGSVGKALYLAGIYADADDMVTPERDQPVFDGMNITVNRVLISTETEKRRLHYYITYQDSDEIYIGEEKMIRQGKEGQKEVTMKVVTVDGVETERTVISERVLATAQNRIIAKGIKPTPTPKPKATPTKTTKKPTPTPTKKSNNSKNASDVTDSTVTIDGKTYKYSKTLVCTLTAYTHTGRKTSTGVWPEVGMVAVDPSVIPYGTKMYIPGYGIGVAKDCGVKGYQIDVFLDTEAECRKFGRKRDKTIYILD